MKALLSVVVGLAVTSGTGFAWAVDMPPACQGNAYTSRAFQSGYNQGVSLVEQAFASVNYDCHRLDSVGSMMTDAVHTAIPAGANGFLLCRYSGLVAGVFRGLDNAWAGCDADCCLEGQTTGRIAGEIYCILSILLGGLVAPDDFLPQVPPHDRCQVSSQTCCSPEFIGTSLSYLGLDAVGNPIQCSQYTVDPYVSVWDATRSSYCDYFPAP